MAIVAQTFPEDRHGARDHTVRAAASLVSGVQVVDQNYATSSRIIRRQVHQAMQKAGLPTKPEPTR